MPPVARLTLKRERTRNSQCADEMANDKNQQYAIGENDVDFDMNDLSNFLRRSQFMALDSGSVSKKGKSKGQTMKFIG